MSVQSPCSMVFTPVGGEAVTLVDIGDWLASLPIFAATQEVFEKDGVLLAENAFKALGGVLVSINLSVETDHDNHAAALDAFLEAELAGSQEILKVEGALVITGESQVATYDPAVLSTLKPGLPFGPVSATTKVYSIRTVLPTLEDL